MSKDSGITLRLDKRNVEICRRNGQAAGQRINTIIDRYAHLIDTQRAIVLGRFSDLELDALTLALKQVTARRSSAAELRQLWIAGLDERSDIEMDARAALVQMSTLEITVLAEALEGRQVNLAAA
jgi:hypothetical protein